MMYHSDDMQFSDDDLYEFDDYGIHKTESPDDDDSEELWFGFLNPSSDYDGDY